MAPLPGLVKDATPPATDTELSPIVIPDGTTLLTTKQHNKIIDYLSGDAGPDFIPQLAIENLVSDLAAKENSLGFTPENIANKGATNGYAPLVSNLVPIANLGTGTPDGTKFLRDDGTFVTPSTGITSINADTTPAQVIAAGTGLGIVDVGATHTLSIDATVATLSGSQILINKTITAAANTLTIASTDLTDTASIARDTNTLAFFSSTTSLELLGVISDETGSGLLVFGTSPTIVTPTIASFTNSQHNHQDAAGGGQLDSTLALSDTANIAYLNTVNTFAAGLLNTFAHDATNPGLAVLPFAGNPSARADGAIWLNVTSQQLFARINGVDVDLGAGGGSGITSINADTTAAQIIAGTTNVITVATVTGTTTIDIDASYVGQSSITTLGTITTGVWNGTAITGANINAASTDLTDSASIARSSNNLSFFAATTSLQLIGVISDETGSGLLVFGTSPTIVTPTIASFANAGHNHEAAAGGGQLNALNALNATGTKDSTTFLRGDNTWAVPAGGGGSDTPWIIDHDIDRFDYDEGGVIFFSLFGPRVTPTDNTQPFIFYNDNLIPEAIVINWPTGDELRLHINGVEEYTLSASAFDFHDNAIQNAGNISMSPIATAILTIENATSSPAATTIAAEIRFRGDRVGFSGTDYAEIIVEMVDTGENAEGEMKLLAAINNISTEFITLNEAASGTIHFKRDVQDFNMSSTGTATIGSLEGLLFTDDVTQIGGGNSYIQRSNASLIANSPTGEDIQLQINNLVELTIALDLVSTPVGTNLNIGGDIIVGDRFQGNKGPDIVGAATITLGDGNYFDITGNTSIDFMTTTGWQAGSVVVLQFDGNGGANDDTASPPANTAAFDLAGVFNASAGDTLTVAFDGTVWRELSRSVN